MNRIPGGFTLTLHTMFFFGSHTGSSKRFAVVLSLMDLLNYRKGGTMKRKKLSLFFLAMVMAVYR